MRWDQPFFPVDILDQRTVKQQGQRFVQLLVQWDNNSVPTWVNLEEFQQDYPNFDLEDKVQLNGDGNVMYGPIGAKDESSSSGLKMAAGPHRSNRMRKLSRKAREMQDA